jgi:hypothetical protein
MYAVIDEFYDFDYIVECRLLNSEFDESVIIDDETVDVDDANDSVCIIDRSLSIESINNTKCETL